MQRAVLRLGHPSRQGSGRPVPVALMQVMSRSPRFRAPVGGPSPNGLLRGESGDRHGCQNGDIEKEKATRARGSAFAPSIISCSSRSPSRFTVGRARRHPPERVTSSGRELIHSAAAERQALTCLPAGRLHGARSLTGQTDLTLRAWTRSPVKDPVARPAGSPHPSDQPQRRSAFSSSACVRPAGASPQIT